MGTNLGIKMRLEFEDEKKPYLLDVSTLLYDFELLHDFSLLLYAEEYRDYHFSQYFWRRQGRPLKDEHRLRASKIIKESPLTVELWVGIAGVSTAAFWTIVLSIEKISNWELNRKKLQLEVKKLEHETNTQFYNEQKAKVEMDNKLKGKECLNIFNSLLKRLENNSIKLKDIGLSSEEIYHVSTPLLKDIKVFDDLVSKMILESAKDYLNVAIAHEKAGRKGEAVEAYKAFIKQTTKKIKKLEREITQEHEEFREFT